MENLGELVKRGKNILIAGHRRPDGDCIGGCIAVCRYLKKIYPEKKVIAYAETMPKRYAFLDKENQVLSTEISGDFDLVIAVDASTSDCLGKAQEAFLHADVTVCIDHHISNSAYAQKNVVDAKASSVCEILCQMMDPALIDADIAEALYIGIAFDSGLFRYQGTSKKTMEMAGMLMEKGIPFSADIDRCFYERTYTQTQLLGRTLLSSMRLMDGKCIVAEITMRTMEFYEAKDEDIEGIVENLRITQGVEVAILLQEIDVQKYKVSLRSNHIVDVSRIALFFGGGGHLKAAGCTMSGSMHDVVNNLTAHIEKQLKKE